MKLLLAILEFLARLFGRRLPTPPKPAPPRAPPTAGSLPPSAGPWIGLALALIMAWEGLYTYAYYDPVGIPTVCYGHIEGVKMGDKYTKFQCTEMLKADIPRYDAQVKRCIKVSMPPHRHAAIVSFTYNVGGGSLCKSSVARYLNAGDVQRGCDALLLYVKAGGRYLKGLENRRRAERELCLKDD